MHIHNPTNEQIDAMYASRLFKFAPGKTIDVEDKASANHIVNEFGPRGLVVLSYGDDTKKIPGTNKTVSQQKCEDGIKVATAFRRKMIVSHNQMNESNKHTRKPYVEPSEQLVRYAAEAGIKLIKPYEVDDLQQQKMNELDKENRELKGMIRDQGDQITKLIAAINNTGATPPPAPSEKTPEEKQAEEIEAMIAKVHSFGRKDYLKTWVEKELDEIKLWPEEAKTELRKKYFDMHGEQVKI